MLFTDLPGIAPQARSMAAGMAATVREYGRYGVRPLIVMEPTVDEGSSFGPLTRTLAVHVGAGPAVRRARSPREASRGRSRSPRPARTFGPPRRPQQGHRVVTRG